LYDKEGPEVLPHIQSFIKTYDLPLNELLIEDLTQYPVSPPLREHRSQAHRNPNVSQTFNSFFARRLKASARPIDGQDDPRIIVSPADCRMTVFETEDQAKKFWYANYSLAAVND
jgi:phosphatidylserine decarboxylase